MRVRDGEAVKTVFDFNDDADVKTAGLALASIVGTPGWAALCQLSQHIRERDISRETDSDATIAKLNGRLSGMKALLSGAEELARKSTAQAGADEIQKTILTSIGTGPV